RILTSMTVFTSDSRKRWRRSIGRTRVVRAGTTELGNHLRRGALGEKHKADAGKTAGQAGHDGGTGAAAARRRTGPARAGPLPRAGGRADRGRPGHRRRPGRGQGGDPGGNLRRDRGDRCVGPGVGLRVTRRAQTRRRAGGVRAGRTHRRWAPLPGRREVVAVDVGYGQLVWRLQTDPRVIVVDRTNVRDLTLEQIGGEAAELIVGDLSFISLTLVLPALARCAAPDADLALMVKPQFEVGRDRLGSGGVVRDPALHADAVRTVAGAAWPLGLGALGITASPLPGPSGNVEYFVWLRAGAAPLEEAQLARAIAEGPAGVGTGVPPRTSVRSDGHRN